MGKKSQSVLLSDMKIKGNLTEKEGITVDSEIDGDINAENVEINELAHIKGNIPYGILAGNIFIDKLRRDCINNRY